jgi:hypothetical protein
MVYRKTNSASTYIGLCSCGVVHILLGGVNLYRYVSCTLSGIIRIRIAVFPDRHTFEVGPDLMNDG